MLDFFNNEIPLGLPKLPDAYWNKSNNEEDGLPEINTDFALKNLSDVSIFNPKK